MVTHSNPVKFTYTSEELRSLRSKSAESIESSPFKLNRAARKAIFSCRVWKPKVSAKHKLNKRSCLIDDFTSNDHLINNIPVRITQRRSINSTTGHATAIYHNLVNVVRSNYTSKNHLKIACVNTRSVKNKQPVFVDHITSEDIDLCVITETWLRKDDDTVLANITPAGYDIRSSPRDDKIGGGLAVLFRDSIQVRKIVTANHPSFEATEWHLKYGNSVIVTIGIYRPPYSTNHPVTVNTFLNEFAEYLESVALVEGHLLITGDFNIHVNDVCDPAAARFINIIDSMGMINHVNIPTHIHGHTLDLIITRASTDLHITDVQATDYISDHSFICATTSLAKPIRGAKYVTRRNLSDINFDSFKKDLQNSEICKDPADTVDTIVNQYDDCLRKVLDHHAPSKSKVVRLTSVVPWFTSELGELKLRRRKSEYKWRASKQEDHYKDFKALRNEFTYHCKLRKKEYYAQEVLRCGNDQKKLYKLVDRLTKGVVPAQIPDHSSIQQLTNDFANFFSRKIDKICQNIKEIMLGDNIPAGVLYEQTEMASKSTFEQFKLLTEEEVKMIVMKCASKQCRLDPVPTYIVKECIGVLIPSITKIVNLSLQSGQFPDHWKCSLVTPLIKKPTLDKEFKNYRPVSNLCFISKVVESAALSQYRNHLDLNNQMPKKNAAYTKFHSTETILLRVQSDILMNMDKQRITMLVLLDLSAAFDTIDYGILGQIFEHKFKVKGTAADWFVTYLTNRQQRVQIDDVMSEPHDVKFGVPQGSCAGPVIFLSYLSSLYDVISSLDVDVGGYADDNQLYLSFKPSPEGHSQTEAMNKLANCISAVRRWMLVHNLKINDSKTEFIIIGSNQQLNKLQQSSITVGNSTVESVSSVRNLGVLFDQNLSMKSHIMNICKKGFYQIYRLRQIRCYFDRSMIERLVHAFITSHIDYANALLFGLPETTIQPLQRLQNAAARLVLMRSKRASATEMLKDLHWLPVRYRIKFKIALLVYKCLHGSGPQYLCELLTERPCTRILRSSSQRLLLVPRIGRETFGKRSFCYAAPTVWNELPTDVRSSQSVEIFKKGLKTYLFGLAFA